jgi:hypothetical protein
LDSIARGEPRGWVPGRGTRRGDEGSLERGVGMKLTATDKTFKQGTSLFLGCLLFSYKFLFLKYFFTALPPKNIPNPNRDDSIIILIVTGIFTLIFKSTNKIEMQRIESTISI